MKFLKIPRATPVLLELALASAAHALPDDKTAVLLKQAIDAQGGEVKLRAIHSIRFEASGYRNELEESERPESPYLTDFFSLTETDDYSGSRSRRAVDTTVYPFYKDSSTTVFAGDVAIQSGGGPFVAGTPQTVQLARERMRLNPEKLLLTAMDAPDVHREADTTLQNLPQNVIAFTLDGAPVRVFLNAYTHLPTAMDYSGPLAYQSYYAFLGDVTLRTYYSLWWLAKDGVHLPMQQTVEGNGMADRMFVIRKLEINAPLAEADLTISPELRAKFNSDAKPYDLEKAKLGIASQPATELAPGVVFIPGTWNCTLVRQDDGVVVLEAPISSGYSAQVLAEAHRRFPGVPVKAVITTSDSWPHIAGIREFVANGIPIYALHLNQPILEQLIAAPRTGKPDLLARTPHEPIFHSITGKTTLGEGSNRLEIIPIRGETSERQMMVYLPQHHLLYGSDPFQKLPDGSWFYPQTITELQDAVTREHLTPDRFFMMHVGPTPWTDLENAVHAAETKNTPDGSLL